MIKRWLLPLGLILFLLLLLGGGYFAYKHFMGGSAAGPVMTPAQAYVPGDAVAYAWIPDAPKARAQLKTTGIWKLWSEPEFQRFWGEWVKEASAGAPEDAVQKEAEAARQLFSTLLPLAKGQAFLAVPALEKGEVKALLGGFEIGPDRAPFDAWVESTKKVFPDPAWEQKDHEGTVYFTRAKMAPGIDQHFCVAVLKGWVLIGLGEKPFLDLLDRVNGKSATPALADSPVFKEQLASQQGRPFATFFYINMAPVWDMLEAKAPAAMKPSLDMKTFRSIEAVSFSTTFENGGFFDHAFVAMPKGKSPDIGKAGDPLAFKTAPLVGADALMASFQNIDPVAIVRQFRNTSPEKKQEIDKGIAQANQVLAVAGVDVEKDLLPSLGPELSCTVTWGEGQPFPGVTLFLQHQNQEMLKKLISMAAMVAGPGLEQSVVEGQPAYVYSSPGIAMVHPGLWIGKDILILTLNGERLADLAKPAKEPLLESGPFTALRKRITLEKPISLAYLDTQRLFSKGYDSFVAYSPMIEAMSGVKLSGKLPPKDLIAPHLGRSMLAASISDKGQDLEYISEQGNPLYLFAFAAVTGKLPLRVPSTPSLPGGMGTASHPVKVEPPVNAGEDMPTPKADPAAVLQELQTLDQAVTAWAQANQKPAGTKVAWVDINGLLPADSPIVERAGLDPVGNAYLFNEIGEHQVQLAPSSVEALKDVPPGFWGKFVPAVVVPEQPPAAAIPTDPVPVPAESAPSP
jgi:hypothetical protein